MLQRAESKSVLPGLKGAFDPSLIFFTQGALSLLQLLSGNFTRVLINQFYEFMQRRSPSPRLCNPSNLLFKCFIHIES